VQNKTEKLEIEFIALMASLMSLVALSIDALLPALSIIGDSLRVLNKNNNQLLVLLIFLGLGVGQLFMGPLSDTLGRKKVVYIGILIFFVGSIICIFSKTIESMLIGRVIQGIGLSSPRTISVAMVRDKHEGNYMARVMSFVTVIFILVPTIAPTLGQYILERYNWKAIFYVQLFMSLLVLTWFFFRQKETLVKAHRIPFTIHRFVLGIKEIFIRNDTLGFTIISGFISGAFITYLSASQQIFVRQYGLEKEFPIIFASLAIAVGTATFLNGILVLKFGMELLIRISLIACCATSLTYIILFYTAANNPSVAILITFFGLQFFSLGFLFGNLKSMAMQPIGHIAGIGAAITGFISTIMAVPIGIYIGSFVHATALPLFIGFFICGLVSLGIIFYLKRLKLK